MTSEVQTLLYIKGKMARFPLWQDLLTHLILVELKLWGHVQFEDIWSRRLLAIVHHRGENEMIKLRHLDGLLRDLAEIVQWGCIGDGCP